MNSTHLFADPKYRELALTILGFLLPVSLLLWSLKKKSTHFMAAWASVKSWLFAAPLLLLVFALPSPWPLVFLTLVSIFSAKTFYQMVGMYHRSWFIWLTYIFIIVFSYSVYRGYSAPYNLSPMIFFAACSLIPLLRNSATQMVQYLALSLMCFIFFGWSFMHMNRLVVLPDGVFIVLYLYILTEFSEICSLAATRLFGKTKLFSNISQRVTLEGFIVSIVMTLILAWGLRHLLPDRSEQFWIAAGLTSALVGRFGDLILTIIRRDLRIKDTGVFIIGRGDILARVDKLIVVGPLYYYIYLYFVGLTGV